MKQVKKHYIILLGQQVVGETWAVSPDKACANYWWKEDKLCNPFTTTDMRPEDYDCYEA